MKKIFSKLTPPQVLTFGFLAIIFVGAFILRMPVSQQTGVHVNFLDALFTAVSATAITGLTVVNTAATWSTFGQVVLLVMIEIGALGFMTFAVLLFAITGQRLDLKARLMAQQALNLRNLADVKSVLSYVFSLSAIIQIVGAVLMLPDFIPRFGIGRGIYLSLASSISAFGNAGFTFFDKPVSFLQNDPYILIIWMLLITAGSLGFLVWRDLLLFHRQRRVSLHTKVALNVSGWLIGLSFAMFLFTENVLAPLAHTSSLGHRILDSLFLAVVPRTAGLEVVPLSNISAAGIMIITLLMFVGGTPGSTSGGIKTTTLGILWMQSLAALRGQEQVNFGGRRFSPKIVIKAMMLAVISIVFVAAVSLLLIVTETIPKGQGMEYIVFEVISAFSTTGFSLGLTPHLTNFGEIVIMIVMFIGRVGLYTVMFSVMNIREKPSSYQYPTEEVIIG
ncbi:potassium transporter TrkG [Weissella paramesenteroides]|uniref:TrkH family potassium uptake protein n=1 Tax=Weissella paramesenteroides TaxID=1249 RepID=UPI00123C62E5|nr:potassium transporter TrkG [Weissella paramesenteroides]KAA8457971.1 Trk family potassium uptake protein [Weissella paramesenteroides]KAA8458813.1 Trk family potassium uptake protein [Weissella paramesenteroides]KAA8459212.1 Trk family potassium uptake protein [Weissella paramesenteroides]KAA8463209.1 Trk family potassium uptake protein [Weissella paramesenteroides]KAA8463953.1 Trk family potassium uptake protein [Weissella paramesenteroides]